MLIILGLGIWILNILYGGFVLTLLWSWFIVPFGVVNITIPWAIGLTCVASMFVGIKYSKGESALAELLMPIVATTFLLGIGFFAHKFM